MKVSDRWWSERLGCDLTVSRWGTWGVPVLLFPTAGGDADEVERGGLIDAVRPLLDAGRAKIYSCDSTAGQALVRREGSSDYRKALFNAYHQAVAAEVVPAIASDCGGPQPLVAAGASIGAFNAVALLCRYPHLVDAALGMSGTFDVDAMIGGSLTDDMYYASPLHFLPGLAGEALDRLRGRTVVLASGTGDWEDISESWRMARLLGSKGVPNRVDDWGPGYPHDWPTWHEMLPLYLDELLP